jgi:hypothetical protein
MWPRITFKSKVVAIQTQSVLHTVTCGTCICAVLLQVWCRCLSQEGVGQAVAQHTPCCITAIAFRKFMILVDCTIAALAYVVQRCQRLHN